MKKLILLFALLATVGFGAQGDKLIQASDGDLKLSSKSGSEIVIDGDLNVTGTSNVSGAAAAFDWAGSTDYGLNEIVVGPDDVMYRAASAFTSTSSFDETNWERIGLANGAVITSPTAFTPEWGNVTEGNSLNYGYWHREGEFMYVDAFIRQGSTGSIVSTVTLTIPDGKTINGGRLADETPSIYTRLEGGGSYVAAGADIHGSIGVNWSSSTAVYFKVIDPSSTQNHYQVTVNSVKPIADATGNEFHVNFKVPILEWEGTGTTNTQTQVECVYNTGSTTTAGATNAVGSSTHGCEGTSILSVDSVTGSSSRTNFIVQFDSDIADDETVMLQVKDGTLDMWKSPAQGSFMYVAHGTNLYGVGVQVIASNQAQATFGNKGANTSGATYGSNGTAWSVLSGWKWRIVRHKNASLVGVQPANDTVPGTLSYEDSGVLSSTWGGAGWTTSPARILNYSRVGKQVTLTFASSIAVSVGTPLSLGRTTALPAALWPPFTVYASCRSYYNGGAWANPSLLEITPAGAVNIYLDHALSSGFANGPTQGCFGTTISYAVD